MSSGSLCIRSSFYDVVNEEDFNLDITKPKFNIIINSLIEHFFVSNVTKGLLDA